MEFGMLNLLIGVVLLFLGRKLFWLFVGVAGFLIGMELASQFYTGSDSVKLLIALVIGIIGAFLAVLFYKLAVAIAGFAIGAYLGVQLIQYLQISIPQSIYWIPYLIGGIIGAILILVMFDWALILLSSFAGASLIVHSVTLRQFNMTLVFIVLVVLGIAVQATLLYRSQSESV